MTDLTFTDGIEFAEAFEASHGASALEEMAETRNAHTDFDAGIRHYASLPRRTDVEAQEAAGRVDAARLIDSDTYGVDIARNARPMLSSFTTAAYLRGYDAEIAETRARHNRDAL